PRGESADLQAPLIPCAGTGIGRIPRSDDQIGLVLAEQFEHRHKQRLIMLQVGIHDRDEWSESTLDSLDDGGGKSTPADPADAAEARILPPCLLQLLNGSVGRIIVHEDDFPLDIAECCTEFRGERLDIFAFVKCRYDDGKLRNRSLRRHLHLRDGLVHVGPGAYELTIIGNYSTGLAMITTPNRPYSTFKRITNNPKIPTLTMRTLYAIS